MKPAVIVDVDGTLADVSGIRHYVLDDPHRKLFHKFHAASVFVEPIAEVAAITKALHATGLTIIILTSRREQWRHITRTWLNKWEIPHHALGMRADHDDRRDDDVKRDLHDRMCELYGVTAVLAIDDNPTVIALWRSMNIPTVRVPGWEEEIPKP